MTSIEDTELYLIGCIRGLQMEYEEKAKPYFDRLAHLRSVRNPQPFIVDKDAIDWKSFSRELPK